MPSSRILVTGANGFVGVELCRVAAERGHKVRGIVRTGAAGFAVSGEVAVLGDIGPSTDWSHVLKGIDAVIHLAARVHVMKESLKDPLSEYRRVNVDGTRNLAMSAARAGIKRMVYVSTIKVNGESTGETPFSETDSPSPRDAYSISKWEAEKALHEISAGTGLEIVIIRPPLVYGPGVKGNLYSLMRHIERGYPLPFGCISNRRSFISLDNLADVLLICAVKAECAGNTFMVSDGEDLSTPGLVRKIARAMNRKPRLINIPEKVFSLVGAAVPRLRPFIERLTGSLAVDSTLIRSVAGWFPCQTVDSGIADMVSAFLSNKC